MPQLNEPLLDAEAINYYYDHAYDFVYDQIVFPAREMISDLKITKQQKELLDEISKYNRVSIESGHGVGKSCGLSWAGLWFLVTRYNTLGYPVKIPAIAPTYHQLSDILWPEFKRWIPLSRLSSLFKVQHDEIYIKNAKDSCFIRARSPSKSDNVQGFHAKHLFWICDEAFGVLDDMIWETIEGSLTEDDNKIILAGQHTTTVGYVHDSFNRDKEIWRNLRFSSEDSPLAKPEYAQRIAKKYGRESDIYRVRVLGQQPKGNPEAFISLERAQNATYRQATKEGRLSAGIDVARFGNDTTVVTLLKGNFVFPQVSKSMTDTDAICTMFLDALRKYRFEHNDFKTVCETNVDATGGYGAGVIDQLKKNTTDNIKVNAINFTGKINNDEYHDGVSKMWGELRDRIDGLQLPADEFLIEEISTRRFKYPDGKIKIEDKATFKKDYGASPDRADSLVLAVSTKTAFKKVMEYFNISEHQKPFTVNFEVLSPTSTLHISQWVDTGMQSSCLTALWNPAKTQLYVFCEQFFNNSLPEIVITQMNNRVREYSNNQIRNLSQFEWFGNETMVKENMGSMQTAYRKYGQNVRCNEMYEENGSILLVNRLLFRKGIIIHDSCKELASQMQSWVVDGSMRPAEGYGLCRSLCNLVATLHEYGKLTKPPKEPDAYSQERTDWLQKAIDEAKSDDVNTGIKGRYDCDW